MTPPATEPITLLEAKDHLRVDIPDDDNYINGLISAAREYAEGYQNRAIGSQTLEYIMDYFPPAIRLPRTPVQSVLNIKYTTPDGTITTVDPTAYVTKYNGDIVLAFTRIWPTNILTTGDAVKIQYTAGYTSIPKTTKQGILLLIGHWYDNREPVSIGKPVAKIPLTAETLLGMDRMW